MAYPSDIGIIVIAVMFALTLITLGFLAARLYTRIVILKLPGSDDWAAVLAWTMLLIYSAFLTEATRHGLGARGTNASPVAFGEMYKMVAIGQSFSYIGVAASKASVALFLLRIVVKTWHRIVLWAIIAVLSTICTLSSILHFARCDPVEACWDATVPGKFLMDPNTFTEILVAASIISVLSDIALVILPWTILYGLQMSRSEKRLIGTALSFGGLAAIAGIIRTETILTTNTSDLSVLMYRIARPLLWCATELCVTICASCVPILRPLWRALRGQSSASHGYSTTALATPSRGIELAKTAAEGAGQKAAAGRLSDESGLLRAMGSGAGASVGSVEGAGRGGGGGGGV
ncbi:aspartic-type endopeptidase [Neofusicoccum parvum]|nr:aspartic-type endopeptidase [Neofusicoccum parvum]